MSPRHANAPASDRVRLARVLLYIDRHLGGPLSLATLAGIASWSPFHFHRIFAATLGVTPSQYVRLARLKHAAHRLAFRPDLHVGRVALDAGYDAPDAFARAFRARVGQAPATFRARPTRVMAHAAFTPLARARDAVVTPDATWEVTVRERMPVPVAIMSHKGDPADLGDTIRRFIAWRRAAMLPPTVSDTYSVFFADPSDTPPVVFRLDLCAALPGGWCLARAPLDEAVSLGVLPGGRCASVRVVGQSDALGPVIRRVVQEWLPQHGETLSNHPPFGRHITRYPDVAESEAVMELIVPLAARDARVPHARRAAPHVAGH